MKSGKYVPMGAVLKVQQGRLYCRKYMGDVVDHAYFCICDNNVVVSAVYMKVQKKGKTNIVLQHYNPMLALPFFCTITYTALSITLLS